MDIISKFWTNKRLIYLHAAIAENLTVALLKESALQNWYIKFSWLIAKFGAKMMMVVKGSILELWKIEKKISIAKNQLRKPEEERFAGDASKKND